MSCPINRRGPPENVFEVQPCASFDEEPDYFVMAGLSSQMQRCRVGMSSYGVVSVWVLARVKQQSNDLDMTKIRCHSECRLAVLLASPREQPTGIFNSCTISVSVLMFDT